MIDRTDPRLVLVVEDDPGLREALCEAVRDEGFEPCEAQDGRQALECLSRGATPCVMLLDLMMPVMNGWQLLDWFKAHPEHRLPVIVMSAASSSDVDRVRGSGPPVTRVMRKPLDLEALLDAVHVACERAP